MATKRNSRGGIKKYGKNSRSSGGDVQGLASQLQGITSVAKGMGIDTARSDAMIAQTRAQGSRSFKGSSYDKGQVDTAPTTITASALAPTKTIAPYAPQTTPVGDFAANNAALAGVDTGLTVTGTQLNQAPAPVPPAENAYDKFKKDMDGLDTPDVAGIQRKLERDNQLEAKRQEVNNYAGQINTITANRDAAVLSLEDTGRGQTTGFIGGEQGRINREAAIKALPIQALLANAQGNLALAEQHIATWGNIMMQDATNKYNAKKEMFKSAFEYADGKEKAAIAALEKKNDRAYAEGQALITAKANLISQALGQQAPSSVVSAIQSATTLADVAAAGGIYNGDILGMEAKRASIRASNASTANIYDQITSRKTALREESMKATTEQAKATAKVTADTEQALELKKLSEELKTMKGLRSAVGFGLKKSAGSRTLAGAGAGALAGSFLGPIGAGVGGLVGGAAGYFSSGDAVTGSSRADFEATASRVANLLTLDNLDLMSGVLSETDIKILETAGSNLRNFDQSETSYFKEVDRIIGTMDRTITKNGITPEQAVFWGALESNDVGTFNSIWETL